MTYIKYFTTIIFVFVSLVCCFGQDITLYTQADVDTFDPSITVMNGNLFVDGNSAGEITNLDNLSNLISIGGYLSISNNDGLINIDGLSNLTFIGQYLRITSNDALININGLSNLTSIGGFLEIDSNNSLSNIDALSNLTSIDGYLWIWGNNSVTNIDSLSNLTSVGGDLLIESSALTNLNGLSNLPSIGGSLRIRNNDALTSIDALSNLTSIGGEQLIIENNALLININGLSNLTIFSGSLSIYNNTLLSNINGLSNLTVFSGFLNINNNNALINIDGLSNLTFIGWDLNINNNNALTNIDGLSNLTSVGSYLKIENNLALTNIDGLSNLTSIGSYLIVNNNASLADCCGIKYLLSISEAISGTITISNNPSECSNQNEVLNAFCGLPIKVFNDINQDCINDNNEIGIANQQLIIQPGDIIGGTNVIGRWYLDYLPPGDYTITIDTSGTWSPTCPITQSFTVIDPFEDTVLPAFGLISTEPCTAPDISIHMPFMRPCFDEQRIYIQACNTNDATGALENAFVILELDSLLTPTSSLIPYTDLGNHMYQFDIGTLNPGICVDFWMETTLSCDAELGQGLCMEAQLFPAEDCVFDDIPNPLDDCNTTWDMSSLEVNGYCENDTVFFEILNNGTGDMTCFSPVNVYINGNLIILDSVQLVSGEIAVFSFSGAGQSWRLETDQHPLHPGNSQPNAMVEGCGGNIATFASFINAMSQDDADPIVDIYCGIVTGSYDPNDKTGFPLGVNESNDILPNQKIEYLIRFQNTGTDTAFTVVIRDTLSDDFDIFSVQSGVSSHAYDFTINDGREMVWTFNDILLPDSTTNEIESHGFIKFTVDQTPNLAEGTVLENTAGIYFDFNDPIITNTSQHTINYFTANIIATTNISEETCSDYLSPSGDYTWTNSGTYYDIIETENGDSIIIIDLMLTISDLTITEMDGSTLTANIDDAEYQWLDCDNNSNPIEGATNQNFIPTETIGNYAVEVTLNECTAISDCFSINTTGIVDHEFSNAVNIHPNPTNKHIFVNLGKKHQATNFTVRNILGQTILQQQINSNEFHFEINATKGLYLLEIETNTGQKATFKILKK